MLKKNLEKLKLPMKKSNSKLKLEVMRPREVNKGMNLDFLRKLDMNSYQISHQSHL